MVQSPQQTAFLIYQGWLDRIADALWSSDFRAVAAAMHYPHYMRTLDGEVLFDCAEKQTDAARDFRQYLSSMGARDYMRLCAKAHFVAGKNDEILGLHTTYVLRGGTYVIPPYSNTMTLILRDGQWLGAGTSAACTNHQCTILSPAQLREQRLAMGKTDIMED